jgi:hypothetical protein
VPERIQLSRTKGWRLPANTVKVDRSTRWGNPFKPADKYVAGPAGKAMGWSPGDAIGSVGAVMAFRSLMANNLRLEPVKTGAMLDQLRGKNLACWCKLGTPCHADVLLELANP